jgi:S1-C subfamily serine protease
MQFSMTKGIVSAVGKSREAGAGTWIPTDAPIDPCNRGGLLVTALIPSQRQRHSSTRRQIGFES